jgi:hypothetical protein
LLAAMVLVLSAAGCSSGMTVNASDVASDLGTGSVASCTINGSSVTVSGQLTHGPGDAAVIGFVTTRIEDGSGNVLGSANQQYLGPPFTSGSVSWTTQVPFSGQPNSCGNCSGPLKVASTTGATNARTVGNSDRRFHS